MYILKIYIKKYTKKIKENKKNIKKIQELGA